MSNRKRTHSAAGKRRRPAKRATGGGRHTSAEPDLLGDVREALADPHPLSLLAFASTLLCATDVRRVHPLARPDNPDPEGVTREDLVGMFLDVPGPETTALLTVIAEMVGDDDLSRARIRRTLAARPNAEPAYLTQLSETLTYRAMRMSHVLGDGDNIMLGVRLPDGYELTCVAYIDHNLGSLVKDAFVLPEPIADVAAEFRRLAADDPDSRWDDVSLADARAWLDEAIDLAAITFPPLETDSWPACRALVEWITRDLPAGGTGYQRPQWDAADLERLSDRFFASPHGSSLDDADHRGLLESLLWYGTDYGPGDPLRWSATRVEILFGDWIPRKIMAPVEFLAMAPDLLRAFIGFAHAETALRPGLTDETLAALTAEESHYQRAIRSPRPQGPEAFLASLGVDGLIAAVADGPAGRESFEQSMLHRLALDVGGETQLDRLEDNPLPDEAFRWDGISDDVTASVREVLELTDRCCAEMLDPEYRTACRRLLAHIARGGPEVFRRRGRTETAAAAIVWIVGKANDLFEQRTAGMQVKEVISHFGLKQSSIATRAATMLRAGGFRDDTYLVRLGSPDYLVASRRRWIINTRERYRQLGEE